MTESIDAETADFPDLVRRCQAGDIEARRILYELRGAKVLGWAKRLARRGLEPEDVAHDVFASIFAGRGGFRGDSTFDHWLFQITKNAALRRPTMIERVTSLLDATTPEPTVAPEGSDPWVEERVRRALERLPEAQRLAVVLYVVEDRAGAEVAELLGVPEGTVRSRVRLGLEGLERALRRDGIDRSRIEAREVFS